MISVLAAALLSRSLAAAAATPAGRWQGDVHVSPAGPHTSVASALRAVRGRENATVVVLGAGFDTRALRFGAAHDGVRWAEVDLPEVVAQKQRLLARAERRRPQLSSVNMPPAVSGRAPPALRLLDS